MAEPNTKEVAKYLLKLRDAQESFEGFVRLIYPKWKLAPFQLELIRTLDALEKDELRNEDGDPVNNLLITMPPRHAKSTFATVLFPSYFMARQPDRFIMSCSYNSQLATDFGRQVRTVVEAKEITQAFPDFKLSQESRAADVWRTTDNGAYFAVGVGGTTSGRPSNCFAAGTLISTPAGPTPIEHIKPGDSVLSWNHDRNCLESKPVMATKVSVQKTNHYQVAGTTITCTPCHRVYDGRTYRPIEDIADGPISVQTLRQRLPRQTQQASAVLLADMLRAAQRGHSHLPDVQGAFHRQALRAANVLLSTMPSRAATPADSQVVPSVRHEVFGHSILHEGQDSLLPEVRCADRSQGSTPKARPPLSPVRKALHGFDLLSAVLLSDVCITQSCQAHPGREKPTLPSWEGQPSLSSRLATSQSKSSGPRRPHVRDLLDQEGQSRRPSYRHGQVEQRTREPHLSVQTVSHARPQDARLVPAHCTKVSEGSYTPVYDIQVADNHNFFAGGILVHNCLIVDDPIKSREDAESITQRNKTWNYYASALATRQQPQNDGRPPKQLIILTRWHPDDLAGRLMQTEDWAEGRWHHVNFPAITSTPQTKKLRLCDLPEDDPEYKPSTVPSARVRYVTREVPKQTPLWPERFPLEDLKRRERLNPREFAALYQQQPYIEGGNIIKTEWWRYYPSDLNPENFSSLIIACDTAFKKTESSDYSVAVVAGVDNTGDIYLVDLFRGRFDFPELKQRLIILNNMWRGKGLRATYIEDKASGQSLIQELKRQSGMAVIPYKTVNDKVARVNAILPIIEGGRVFLPEVSPWLDGFIEEAVQFPNGTHDDQVDAVTIAIDVLSRTAITPDAYDLTANLHNSLANQHQTDPDRLQNALGKSINRQLKRKTWPGWGI